ARVHASAILSEIRALRFLCFIQARSIDGTSAPNFLLAKLTRDFGKRMDIFGTLGLSS
ncbi:hypothetical protein J3R82DRAFT_8281, partial [Butyriboletus roseoflavus]